MLRKFIWQIIAAIISIWLAIQFIPGITFSGNIKTILLIGLVLGLTNAIIKPIIDLITLPLKALTFGLFSLVIIMGLVWGVDILFPEIDIVGLKALAETGLLVWFLNFIATRL